MEYRQGEYFLDTGESVVLWNQAVWPNESLMARRDRFFADIDTSTHITHTLDGGMIIKFGAKTHGL